MHLLVILLEQLLGLLSSEQSVPQVEVVRPRSSEPRGSDSSAMAGWNFQSGPFSLTTEVCAIGNTLGGGALGNGGTVSSRIGAGWGHMLSMVFGKRFGSGGRLAEGNLPAAGSRTRPTFPGKHAR
ncbi:MAG TPA: hypothetical protein VIK18_24140 [Pirellulales bacterium]